MGPRGFWIALAVVLLYLIARPHIGTVWHMEQDPSPYGTLPPGLTPVTPPPGFGSPVPAVLPTASFTDKRDCFNAAMRFESATSWSGVYCAGANALLWGW